MNYEKSKIFTALSHDIANREKANVLCAAILKYSFHLNVHYSFIVHIIKRLSLSSFFLYNTKNGRRNGVRR